MDTVPAGTVVVGVDGSTASAHAVHFAALRAQRHGAILQVVHVAPLRLPFSPTRTVEPPLFEQTANEILHSATAAATQVAPGLTVHARVCRGSLMANLIACADEARELVIGVDHRHGMDRIWTGAVGAGLAARAACPVVVVPPEWRPENEYRRVVVGFKSPDRSRDLLAEAFAEAAERQASLVIVHAWKLPSAYDDIISARVSAEDVEQHTVDMISPLIADLRQAHPGVRVRICAEHAQTAQALVSASRTADLLVLMRVRSPQVLPHLGGTARALLREAECPVVVFPGPTAEIPDAPMVLEEDGQLKR